MELDCKAPPWYSHSPNKQSRATAQDQPIFQSFQLLPYHDLIVIIIIIIIRFQFEHAITAQFLSSLKVGYAGSNFPEHQFPSIVGRPILRTEERDSGGETLLKDILCGDDAAKVRSMLQISYPVRPFSTPRNKTHDFV